MSLAISLGGTITGEHGVGRLKRAGSPEQLGPDVMALTTASSTPSTHRASSTPEPDSDDRHTARARHHRPVRSSSGTSSGPGPCNPYPEATLGPGGSAARPPRPGLPRRHGRDVRPAALRLGHRQPPHPAAVGDRVGRHGGGVRQHGRARRRRRRRGQRPLRRAHGRRRRPARCRGRPCRPRVGQTVDVERVVAAHPAPKIIAAVHAETSTGVRSDIAALGAAKGDALLLVDAVTSIGGIELRADDWGIDIGYAGTQKCLGVAPGLAPFTISDRAFARRVEKPTSWYLDLGLLGGYVGEASGDRQADLPPHRAHRDGREPPRRPAPDRRRGPREGLGPPRRGGPAPAGRARGRWG